MGIVVAVALVCAGTASAAWNWWSDAMRGAAQRTAAGAAWAPPSGCIQWLTFDQQPTGGTNYQDASGSNNYVTSASSGASPTVTVDNVVYFDGGDKLTGINESSFDTTTNGFALAYWIKITSTAEQGTVNKGNTAAADGGFYNYYYLTKIWTGVAGGHVNNKEASHSMSTGSWAHVVVVWNPNLSGTDRIELYYNGSTSGVTKTQTGIDLPALNNNLPFTIGNYSATYNAPLSGYLDEIMFYNRALSASEVTNVYQNTNKGKVP
jgi:hypothetical protein